MQLRATNDWWMQTGQVAHELGICRCNLVRRALRRYWRRKPSSVAIAKYTVMATRDNSRIGRVDTNGLSDGMRHAEICAVTLWAIATTEHLRSRAAAPPYFTGIYNVVEWDQ